MPKKDKKKNKIDDCKGKQCKLPPMGGDIDSLTISGFSSGGQMANMLTVIFSETIKGTAINMGGAHGFVMGDGKEKNGKEKQKASWDRTDKIVDKAIEEGNIDDVKNLKKKPIHIVAGKQDKQFNPELMEKVKDFYEKYKSNVEFKVKDVAHYYPHGQCPKKKQRESPDCDDDQTEENLTWLFKQLDKKFKKLNELSKDWADLGVLRKYDQLELAADGQEKKSGFFEYGYVYTPNSCLEKGVKCKIHVMLHGCGGSAKNAGMSKIVGSRMLEWASTNDLIVAFPQNMPPECWSHDKKMIGDKDWYNKNGKQPQAFKNLFDRLSEPRDESIDYTSFDIAQPVADGKYRPQDQGGFKMSRVIIGALIGGLLLGLIIGCICCYCIKKKKTEEKATKTPLPQKESDAVGSEFVSIGPPTVNNDMN